MSSHDYFRKIAAGYDSIVQRAMPRNEEMLAELVRCLPDDATSVLELGCGTGRLTVLMAAKYPAAAITAVDAAQEMIDVARERVSATQGHADRVQFLVSAFDAFAAEAGAYDVIASNWSLHHILEKEPFYTRLRRMMVQGGTFALGDELFAEPPELQARNDRDWLALVRQPGQLSESELADILRHDAEFDHLETLREHMRMLGAAGFDPVDCAWRWRNSAVVVARAA